MSKTTFDKEMEDPEFRKQFQIESASLGKVEDFLEKLAMLQNAQSFVSNGDRLAYLVKLGLDIFDGVSEDFMTWLNTSSIPLGSIKPIKMLSKDSDINLVLEQLKRMKYGVY